MRELNISDLIWVFAPPSGRLYGLGRAGHLGSVGRLRCFNIPEDDQE